MCPVVLGSGKPFFQRIDQFAMSSKWVDLAGDWNPVLDLGVLVGALVLI